MKLIDVLIKQANKEIKEGTILKVPDEELFGKKSIFEFYGGSFYGEEGLSVEELYPFDTDFLNSEVELIPPKEKKYLVKLKFRGLLTIRNYLNYYNDGIKQWIELGDDLGKGYYQTRFKMKELQSNKLLNDFLKDLQGKYELIEVEE
ncbi:hypothetical protein CIRMBP1310_01698 [Enterococcus cecorum]|uniref:hypothetical protein n=1 Tax=Enterococcus cecorum TaxID=44008 RepID=UPI000AE2FE7E|nr:hypothetical protein [Enterococcus cecorum]MCJ0535933.1 hypothetical protein [Enterococcus cecorum]MCJ0554966.1 hypothetical protein [Enterococcus cecorum]CAI3479457.1 hypothetical protein CIRMBP1310_01698 [Enterococcus cecorum]CAI3502656.1 hypothetical protein CIRMBP1311_02101 [Enterococcus cecorum]